MLSSRALPATLLALAACGGQPARAQMPAPPPGADRPNLYHVREGTPGTPAPQEQQIPPYIEVSGQGSATVSPDRARAVFAVETRAKTAGEAASANAQAMSAVLSALRGAGIQGLQVESFGYSLQPQYTYSTQGGTRTREISGYAAVNNVRATVSDVSAVGRVIDTAVGAGANRVASLSFEATDTEDARREALTQAVRAARLQADAIATALGRQLGQALEVHGGAQTPGPRPMMEAAMRAAPAPETPIEAADQTITASVTIRFALGPAGEN